MDRSFWYIHRPWSTYSYSHHYHITIMVMIERKKRNTIIIIIIINHHNCFFYLKIEKFCIRNFENYENDFFSSVIQQRVFEMILKSLNFFNKSIRLDNHYIHCVCVFCIFILFIIIIIINDPIVNRMQSLNIYQQ